MDKVYVLVELGYDYDDQYYSQPQCGGGNPLKFYTNKEEADKVCAERNSAARKRADPEDYSYCFDGEPDVEQLTFYEVVEVPLG